MIVSRQAFNYRAQVLLEKVVLRPPHRYEALFPSEGCFVYVAGAGATFYSSSGRAAIESGEAALLKCGAYLVDWLKTSDVQQDVVAYALHLYPEVLRHIYRQELPQLIGRQLSTPAPDMQRVVPNATLTRFAESLDFYFQNPELVNDDLLELKIKELMLLLVQTENASSVVALFARLFSPRTVGLQQVVQAHLFSNLSVHDLARLCHLSVSSFKREFKKVFNDTPAHYITAQRVKKAASLLKNSSLSVSEIAWETGYEDPAYFSRLFKRATGCSPSEFRSQ